MWRSNGFATAINWEAWRSMKAKPAAEVAEPDVSEMARVPRDVLMQFVGELPEGYRAVFNLYCIRRVFPPRHRPDAGNQREKLLFAIISRPGPAGRRIRAYLETH